MVGRMERIPEDIKWALQDQNNTIDGSSLKLVDMVKMLSAIMSSQPISIFVGTLDGFAGVR